MKEIHVTKAVGMVLGHDLTKIIPGEFKGRLFKKGHVICEEDIPHLLDIGKEHIYAMEIPAGFIHENDAAERMGQIILASNIQCMEPHEGKVIVKSQIHGLFTVDVERLQALNLIGDIAVATKLTYSVVKENETVAALRVVPLLAEEQKLLQMQEIVNRYDGFIQIEPFPIHRVGVVTTGSEVAKGRIQDRFGPVVKQKIESFGSYIHKQIIVGDEQDKIIEALQTLTNEGCDLLICTGGMSVDPDDRTPGAIRTFATEVVSYGVPMLPGSMLMLAYRDNTPIFGVPGGAIYDPKTSFDVILPRVLAGHRIQRTDLMQLGHGGYL